MDALDEIGGGAGDLDGLVDGELGRGGGSLGALVNVVEKGGALDQDGDRLAETNQAAVEVGDGRVELGGVAGDLGHGGEDGGAVSDDGGGQEGDGEDGETHVDGLVWGVRVEVKVVCLDGLKLVGFLRERGKEGMGGGRANWLYTVLSLPHLHMGSFPFSLPLAALTESVSLVPPGVEGGKVDHHRMWAGHNRGGTR